jgi:hypothetical protein
MMSFRMSLNHYISRLSIIFAVSLICVACSTFETKRLLANGPYLAKHPDAFVGTVVDNGHCVKFVQAAAGAPRTTDWRPGAWVRDNPDVVPGTAIATFEEDGTYTSEPGNHAAIYVGQDATGLWVYDQWRGQPVHKRLIRFEGGKGAKKGNKASKSNNGNLYRVIQ